MRGQRIPCERFRCSCLTVAGEWCLASTMTGLMVWGLIDLSLTSRREALILAALPLVWAAGWSLRWACRTWRVTADGLLIIEEGVLLRKCQTLLLDSAHSVEPAHPLLGGLLDTGHVTFQAADPEGRVHRLEASWVAGHSRLCALIEARGRLPLQESRPWWRGSGASAASPVGAAGYAFEHAPGAPWQDRSAAGGGPLVEDYGRFMACCHRLLRAARGRGQWPPRRIPAGTLRIWLLLLAEARVLVPASNPGGLRLAGGINSLEEIERRIGQETFPAAVRRVSRQAQEQDRAGHFHEQEWAA